MRARFYRGAPERSDPFVEPQAYNWQKPSTGYLSAMSKHITMSQTHLMRIDNMQPDPNKVGIFVQPSKH